MGFCILQDGSLPVLNGVITPFIGDITPFIPFLRPFTGIIVPCMTSRGPDCSNVVLLSDKPCDLNHENNPTQVRRLDVQFD